MSKFYDAVMKGESSVEFLYTDAPGLIFEVNFASVDDRLIFKSIGIRASDHLSTNILTVDYRKIPLRTAERWCRRQIALLGGAPADTVIHWGPTRTTRPGSKGREDLYYAEFAAQYVEIFEETLKQPTATLAKRLQISIGSASHILHTARLRGLLSPTTGGKAGGYLTDKAKKMLYETESTE